LDHLALLAREYVAIRWKKNDAAQDRLTLLR
jgi:hypothetical protein